jgi:hypothetical protein
LGFLKDKVKPLAVIMDMREQSLPVSVIHAAGIFMALGAECPVINPLSLNFGRINL